MLLRRSHVLRDAGIAVAVLAWATSGLLHADARLMWLIGLGGTGVFLALLGLDAGVRQVRASVDGGGVRVGDTVVVARKTIRSGWIERSFEGVRIHLDRGVYPDAELQAWSDEEAVTLLRALACDPSQTVVRFPSIHRSVAMAGSAAMAGQLFARDLIGWGGHPSASQFLLLLASCFLWALLIFVFKPHETSVGVDGVLISGLLRSRFVPFAEIESAAVESVGKVVLRTRAGGRVVCRMRGAAADAAVDLIRSAIAPGSGDSEPARRQLRRDGDGDVGAWLARLRSLASHATYRTATFGGDSLWRVVDDPNATEVERAAAAVVLGAAATDDERARLRSAAARMASPPVRVAMQRVADVADPVDDAELAVAMEAVAARDPAA
jgi:hypothetical protein